MLHIDSITIVREFFNWTMNWMWIRKWTENVIRHDVGFWQNVHIFAIDSMNCIEWLICLILWAWIRSFELKQRQRKIVLGPFHRNHLFLCCCEQKYTAFAFFFSKDILFFYCVCKQRGKERGREKLARANKYIYNNVFEQIYTTFPTNMLSMTSAFQAIHLMLPSDFTATTSREYYELFVKWCADFGHPPWNKRFISFHSLNYSFVYLASSGE